MEVEARPATSAEVSVLADLARVAIDEKRPQRGGQLWLRTLGRAEPLEPTFEAELVDPDVCVLLGTIDGVPVGYGVVRREVLRDGSSLATVTDLFTLDGARGVSVGEVIMDGLVAWATSAGCTGIDAIALPGDRSTKNFFETFGLVARAIVVHRSLEGE